MKWPAEPKLDKEIKPVFARCASTRQPSPNAAQRAKAGGVDGYRPHMSLLAKQVHYLSATTPLKNWQAALVLPQACGILEILLHELVRGLFGWNALK